MLPALRAERIGVLDAPPDAALPWH